jgi:hypothetical protein
VRTMRNTQIHCVGRMQNSVGISHEKDYVSATKPNRLMLFKEIIAVYCENHTEHTNTLCGQNAEFSSYLTGKRNITATKTNGKQSQFIVRVIRNT